MAAWGNHLFGVHPDDIRSVALPTRTRQTSSAVRLALLTPYLFAALACATEEGAVRPVVDAGTDTTDATDASPDTPLLDAPFVDATGCIEDGTLTTIGPDEDHDEDGWSLADGDCNDCDPNTNPGAFDVADNDVDEDCSGKADDEPSDCDDGIEMATNVPEDGARALGICRFAAEEPLTPQDRTWGVVQAGFVMADGTTGMHYASRGVLPDFGPNVQPQEGSALLVLSSASARRIGDEDYVSALDGDMGTTSATPPGWPRDFPSCPDPADPIPIANDSAALSLRIRVPTNAYGLSFRFAFFTTEFPKWVCHQYNDYFVALLASSAPNPNAQAGNVSFDGEGNPISTNTAFLEVCHPQVVQDEPYACLLGDSALAGNGFGPSADEPRGHAGTGWLETSAAVMPGEVIDLRFAVWDAGDHTHGSTVVIDGFKWRAQGGVEPETVRVPSVR